MTPPCRCRRCGMGSWADDFGATLVELMVAMTVTVVVGAVATAGLVQMYTSAGHNETLSRLTAQLHISFQRLDREIRYATGIRQPSTAPSAAGYRYVEYAVVVAGATQCTQLRLGADKLQRRTRRGTQPTGGWSTLASGVADGARFAWKDATSGGFQHQRLTIALTVRAGSGRSERRRPAEYTFTALNTSVETLGDVCVGMDRP